MASGWPALSYGAWSATCDTLHAHTQVLGKLEVELAPPEPQLQHAALRLTPRGWETYTLPARDGSGAIVRKPLACSPCHIARIEDCVAAHKCMTGISVDVVIDTIRNTLSAHDAE